MEPITWKIVRKSNFDYEDWRGDQYFVAENIKHERQAKIMAEALNDDSGDHGDDFFEVVPHDYVLPPEWEP